ncbi:hypothetical protein [Streptomyces sp. CL12]|uniref:hypothetical protein n=1 Tax=Streptomyces sp. CL12 TaxID=3391744 RepID=UPI003A801756
MDNTPIASALTLRAMASAFDAQRGKLPKADERHRFPDVIAVARQITELAKLTEDLSDEVLFRAAESDQAPGTARAIGSFAEAITPASAATAALGSVAQQLAFLNRTEHLREQPDAADARAAAHMVIEDALDSAGAALHETARVLSDASASLSLPSNRIRAARSRSTTASSTSVAPAQAAVPKSVTPLGRQSQGR